MSVFGALALTGRALLVATHPASTAPSAAKAVYDNLKVSAPSTRFLDVKRAFESVYAEVGISCGNVGGLWDEDAGAYFPARSRAPRTWRPCRPFARLPQTRP